MIQRTSYSIQTVCIGPQRTPGLRLRLACLISAGLLGSSLAGAAADADATAGAAAPAALQAADQDGAAKPGEDAVDGMGHLPGHLRESAGDDDAAEPMSHHHHGEGMAAEAQSGGADDGDAQAEACEAMQGMEGASGGHSAHHHAMMMGGHEHGSASGQASGDHDSDVDATLAAISAPPPPAWLQGIELDEAQQDRIFEILHESAAAQRKAHRTAERTHHQLKHIGLSTDYNESAARKLSDQHAQAIAELTMLRVRNEKRILEVLKPEQRRDAAHQAARQD